MSHVVKVPSPARGFLILALPMPRPESPFFESGGKTKTRKSILGEKGIVGAGDRACQNKIDRERIFFEENFRSPELTTSKRRNNFFTRDHFSRGGWKTCQGRKVRGNWFLEFPFSCDYFNICRYTSR